MKRHLIAPVLTTGLSALLIGISCDRASAQQFNSWVGGTGSWFNGNNWVAEVPNGQQFVEIINGGTAQIFAPNAIANNLTLGPNAPNSGTLHVGATGTLKIQSLTVGSLGNGTLTIFDGGAVQVGTSPSFAGPVTINGLSALNIGTGGLPGSLTAGSINNNGLLSFNHTNAAAISAAISGSGSITKAGAGVATLSSVAGFAGNVSVSGGQIILQGNLNAGGYSASSGGTLRFENGLVALSAKSIHANAASSVEYSGARVGGGFLRGPGTHAIVPAAMSSEFSGVTTFNSTNINQNGPTSLLNFVNGGTLTNNAALTLSGGANASTGSITVNNLFSTVDFGTNGVLTVNNGGAIINGASSLVMGGGSRTTVNAGGTIALLAGTALELNGALLVNNGAIDGTVNVNYGSLAKGAGTYGTVNVFDGGEFSPGNSPGEVHVGSMNLNEGGRLVLEIRDFNGTPGVDFDEINIAGDLNFNAGTTSNSKLTIELVTLNAANQPGPATNFNATRPLSLSLFNVDGAISGFSADEIAFDLSGFQNDLAGGSFAITPTSGGLDFNFQPALPGDFNLDGSVDAADYVVWRKGLGTSYTQAAYNVWRSHFGQPSGSGAGATSNAAVPEPATSVLLMLAVTGLFLRRYQSA